LTKINILPSDLYSIIVGKPSGLEKNNSTFNTRFKFKQSIDHYYYVIYSFLKLFHYCSNIPYLGKSIRKGKICYFLEFSTSLV